MRIIVRDNQDNLDIKIPNAIVLNQITMHMLKDKMDMNINNKDLKKMLKIIKNSKDILGDEPLVEIISENDYVRIEL